MSGPQCAHNPPTLDPASGAGHVQQIGGFNTYVTGDQDSKLAIIFLADAFGWEVPKLRKLADKVAESGFLVVVPDFYYGDKFTLEKAGQGWVDTHPPDRGCDDARTIIAALKSKGVSKIGAAGFCWGGMVAVRLAKYDCIEAAVVLHPGPITVEEINEVKTPIAILGAEIDHIGPPEMVKQLEDVLSSKPEVDSFVKIFPGVGHGWTVRYNDDDEFEVKSALESHSDMLNWLTKYVK
ncbi:endo-1,3;1,4-beta-D-glucanase-like [Sesamum indicum]|uniref:Endo-1,31,4-beta-D-glucanase-like n=1 Tax=Sesamum indicum TaxID=4182 RepID=A0A6I9TX76_SESIN|nr:endo-1,3;1,4-beta-D-glucanase-like [Sesamum indicum]